MRVDETLIVYVDFSCPCSLRALDTVLGCAPLRAAVTIEVRETHEGSREHMPGAVPAIYYRGKLVHLGTPDCEALLALVRNLQKRESATKRSNRVDSAAETQG